MYNVSKVLSKPLQPSEQH